MLGTEVFSQNNEKYKIERDKTEERPDIYRFIISKIESESDIPFGIIKFTHLTDLKSHHQSGILRYIAEEAGIAQLKAMIKELKAELTECGPMPKVLLMTECIDIYTDEDYQERMLGDFLGDFDFSEALNNAVIHLTSKHTGIPQDDIAILVTIVSTKRRFIKTTIFKSQMKLNSEVTYFNNIHYALAPEFCVLKRRVI